MDIFVSLENEATNEAIIFEDDGRCAYAYWRNMDGDMEVVAHVWLYNRLPSPEDFEFDEEGCAPMNAAHLVNDRFHREFVLPKNENEIELRFIEDDGAEIFVNRQLVGRLFRDDPPGYSVHASVEGPLAKPLIISHQGQDSNERDPS